MPESKTFTARALGTITCGVVLVHDFADVTEAISWLAGFPVFTHELPAKSRELTPALLASYPELPKRGEVNSSNWLPIAERLDAAYPDGIALEQGTGTRQRDPLSTLKDMLPPDKAANIIVVTCEDPC
jgi:hypothetical protein